MFFCYKTTFSYFQREYLITSQDKTNSPEKMTSFANQYNQQICDPTFKVEEDTDDD